MDKDRWIVWNCIPQCGMSLVGEFPLGSEAISDSVSLSASDCFLFPERKRSWTGHDQASRSAQAIPVRPRPVAGAPACVRGDAPADRWTLGPVLLPGDRRDPRLAEDVLRHEERIYHGHLGHRQRGHGV